MRTISFNLPENLDISEPELKIILAGELYERERRSLGQAAELTGLQDAIQEVKQARKSGKKLQTLADFLDESRD